MLSAMSPKQLRGELDRLRLSSRDAAEMFGVHVVTVRKWLAGMQPIPLWAKRFLEIVDRPEPPTAA